MTDPIQDVLYVAIYTDGMGTYQAQCMGCPWKGSWRRKEAKAVEDGKTHTAHMEGAPMKP
jgi:hypothetical protein